MKFSAIFLIFFSAVMVSSQPFERARVARDVTPVDEQYSRELASSSSLLDEREPFFPLIFAALRIASAAKNIAKVAKGVKKGVNTAHKAHSAHENHKNHKRDLELSDREIDELLERDPFFPLIFAALRIASAAKNIAKGVKKGVSAAHKAHSAHENHKREPDVLDMSDRELSELMEREPFFPLIFAALRIASTAKNIAKGVKKGVDAAHKAHSAHENHKKRSFEDEDLDEISVRDLADIFEREELYDL